MGGDFRKWVDRNGKGVDFGQRRDPVLGHIPVLKLNLEEVWGGTGSWVSFREVVLSFEARDALILVLSYEVLLPGVPVWHET